MVSQAARFRAGSPQLAHQISGFDLQVRSQGTERKAATAGKWVTAELAES